MPLTGREDSTVVSSEEDAASLGRFVFHRRLLAFVKLRAQLIKEAKGRQARPRERGGVAWCVYVTVVIVLAVGRVVAGLVGWEWGLGWGLVGWELRGGGGFGGIWVWGRGRGAG